MKRPLAFALAAMLCAAGTVRASADPAGFLYTYALNESRLGDFIYSLDASKPFGSPASAVRPFVDIFGLLDTKTAANGNFTSIYSDNFIGAALGVQYTNGKGLRTYVQGGATTKLGQVAAVQSGGDIRGGVQLYREWGGASAKSIGYGNFYGSGTYYSRYQDTIFYNQLELGARTSQSSRATEFYLRPVFAYDTHGYYYDRVAEITTGFRLHPFGSRGPSFAVEEAAGTYYSRSGLPAGITANYLDFRPTIAYGVAF